jgi:hypothetical protein
MAAPIPPAAKNQPHGESSMRYDKASGYRGPMKYPAAPAKIRIDHGWGNPIRANVVAVTPKIPDVRIAALPTLARRRVEKISLLAISPNQKSDVATLAPARL